jgi:DNA repair exonuclease SbcCD nuclease subunit
VIEKAGFCVNVFKSEERQDKILLNPVIFKGAAIYGYPGKKSGLEVQELRKIKLQDAPGYFKILMLHTSIRGAVGSLPIDSILESELPEADYYALGHLHINYADGKFIYSGPIFPNNFQEIEELKYGSFYIHDNNSLRKVDIKIKETEIVDMEIKNALIANELISLELGKRNLEDKILLLRLSGKLEAGKPSNINFKDIEILAKQKKVFAMLKSTSGLVTEEPAIDIEISNMDNVEEQILSSYVAENPTDFSKFIPQLMSSLSIEKQEDEKSATFESRLIMELKKVIGLP